MLRLFVVIVDYNFLAIVTILFLHPFTCNIHSSLTIPTLGTSLLFSHIFI